MHRRLSEIHVCSGYARTDEAVELGVRVASGDVVEKTRDHVVPARGLSARQHHADLRVVERTFSSPPIATVRE